MTLKTAGGFLFAIATLLVSPAMAMTFTVDHLRTIRAVIAWGEIIPGDADRLAAALKSVQRLIRIRAALGERPKPLPAGLLSVETMKIGSG